MLWSRSAILGLCLLTAFGVLSHIDHALASTQFPPFGGQGDHDVTDRCASGEYLVGLEIRSGSWVDKMALVCAPVDPNTGATGASTTLQGRGGEGGGVGGGKCLTGFIIRGVGLNMTAGNRQVREFLFECTSTTGSARHSLSLGNAPPVFPSILQMCPAGEAVVGIRIRFGRHVNAVGLTCDTFKQIEIPPPPKEEVSCANGGDEAPKEWLDMLAVHNERRAEHCTPALKWCDSLAKSAQVYADKCILNAHGNDATTGENMADAWAESNGNPVLPALSDRDAFEQTWYCEVNNYDFNNPVFKGGFTSNCRNVNGHFTQVVWKDTDFVGCGRATCDIDGRKGTHWVCRYKPRGNVNVDNQFVLAQQVHPRGNCR
jgi:hypothetical protein